MTDIETGIETLCVTLPIGLVPEHATVTKIKGSKTYTVRDKLVVYLYPQNSGPPQEIAARGTRYLIAEDGSLMAAAHSEEFEWHVTPEDLHRWLSERLESAS